MFDWLKSLVRKPAKPAPPPQVDIPSITQQTKWPVGFFDFGKAKHPGVRYFNCSAVERADGLWLIARRSHTVAKLHVGMNDIVALKMDERKNMLGGKKIAFPTTLREQHHEDPRVSVIGGSPYVSATTFQVSMDRRNWTGAHQCIARVTDNWSVDAYFDPIYGKNGGSPLMNSGNEKNWIWFDYEGKPHLIYLTRPHTVVRWSSDFSTVEETYITDCDTQWNTGEPRGGSPPVRVGDEYWSFFHSSVPWTSLKRRYHMGVYAFMAEPPFRVTRMSTVPILSGSQNDEWHEGLPLVVFPCGALLRNGQWLVTMGVNDCASAWIEIPHKDVVKHAKIYEPICDPEAGKIHSIPEIPTEINCAADQPVAVEAGTGGSGLPLAPATDNQDGHRHARKRGTRATRKRAPKRSADGLRPGAGTAGGLPDGH